MKIYYWIVLGVQRDSVAPSKVKNNEQALAPDLGE